MSKPKLNLYTIFHLNLAYSSIAERDRIRVIKKCYWPLLTLAEKYHIPIGVEASGYTLEQIQLLDPSWVSRLRLLISQSKCEFIGSGYAQIIGPLVPAEVNEYNLFFGNEVYESLLGARPSIVYVNEQAYSAGLIEHYLRAGYKAMVMEWNNPRFYHPEWKKEWQYFPQRAINQDNKNIPVIWNNSIAFQKFQRYAHGEIELDEYQAYLQSQRGSAKRFFPLYGNDVEIFDFRPARYSTEAELVLGREWVRIRKLFEIVSRDPSFAMVLPSRVLALARGKHAFHNVRLESAEDPIPVKKQAKYNVTRWALTGRNSVCINTKCYEMYEFLKHFEKIGTDAFWKELCFLWSSDFRTHIEEKRFQDFECRLTQLLTTLKKLPLPAKTAIKITKNKEQKGEKISISKVRGLLFIETDSIKVVLNCRRGLAIDSLIFKKVSTRPLIGTLPHGYYDDITMAADFYTGNTIISIPGRPQLTDLAKVEPVYPSHISQTEDYIPVTGVVRVGAGTIYKTILIFRWESRIDIKYSFDLSNLPPTSFHSGIVTFNPDAFDRKSLYYACHNGGREKEIFPLGKTVSISNDAVSFLVSSRNALGNTTGVLEVGDKDKSVLLKTDMTELASLPMIRFLSLPGTFFMRVLFSLGEIDETTQFSLMRNMLASYALSVEVIKRHEF